jgi:glycosyltransferase involved in cell wall biosynthesis
MTKKVSVILPAYNSVAYLPRAVESILAQSYPNFELVVVNDGSSDQTAEYLRSIRDDRLVVITNETNIGITASLNKAVDLASGEYIARMDADDIAMPRRLQRQVEFLEVNGYDLVSAAAHTINKFPRRTFGTALNDQETALCLYFFNPVVHPLVFGKASVFRKHRYVKDFEWAEDYYLWTRLVLSGHRIGIDSEPLLLYRLHSGQVSVSKQQKQIALTNAVRDNFLKLSAEAAGKAVGLHDGLDAADKFHFALTNLVRSERISRAAKGKILRHILAVEIKCWREYRNMGNFYCDMDAQFSLSDRIIGLASVMDKHFNSTIVSRVAKRFIS